MAVVIRCCNKSSSNEVGAFQLHITSDPKFLPQESNIEGVNPTLL
jgi:hypothetical protein